MPIDYTKIRIKDQYLAENLKRNSDGLLGNYTVKTTKTNDNVTVITHGTYKGLRFKIADTGIVVIDGSLHKAMNHGLHNHNDFSYYDLLCVVSDLCNTFGINPHDALIESLEIGVNLDLSYDPQEFTDRCSFIFTNAGVIRPSPIVKRDLRGFDNGIRFDLGEYAVKIYNKSRQYNLDNHKLRVEYKTRKSRAIKNTGIETLYDLCDIGKLQFLVDNYLMAKFNGVMVDEVVSDSDLETANERRHYHNRLDYVYWRGAKGKQRQRNRGYIN